MILPRARGDRAGRPGNAELAAAIRPARPRGSGALPAGGRADRMPWLIAAAVFAVYGMLAVFRYLHYRPTSYDLGIFTEYVKQYAHLHAPVVEILGPGMDLLGDHFHPILALLAPFFLAFPSPLTLVVAQALLAAISVIPVCRAAEQLLGTGESRAIGAAYGLSWGLQQLIFFDFHEVAFAVPLLAFSLSALVRGRHRAAVAWAVPLVFVKEDLGFTVALIGVLLAWRCRRPVAGLLLAGWGIVWSLLAIFVIIPHLNPHHQYSFWAKGGAVRLTGSTVTPGGLAHQLVTSAAVKLPTLGLILLTTAFLALRSPVVLTAVPGLLLRFVATDPSYWSTAWHYNATVMPIIFIGAVDAMAAMRAAPDQQAPAGRLSGLVRRSAWRFGAILQRHGTALIVGICAALIVQFPLSTLWQPQTYRLGAHEAADRAAMAHIPDGATVQVTLNLLAPLAARADAFWLGTPGNPQTQYIVFDAQSPDYQLPPGKVPAFVQQLRRGTHYRQIFSDGGVYVFRRVPAAG